MMMNFDIYWIFLIVKSYARFRMNKGKIASYMPNRSHFAHVQRWYYQVHGQLRCISNTDTWEYHGVSMQLDAFI